MLILLGRDKRPKIRLWLTRILKEGYVGIWLKVGTHQPPGTTTTRGCAGVGEPGQTVNLVAKALVGSNPTRPTKNLTIGL